MKKLIIVISLIIVIASALFCMSTRQSYTNILSENQDKSKCPVLNINFSEAGFDEDVFETADLVAKIKIVDNGKQMYECTYFKARVEKVYKGDIDLEKQEIGVFQDVYFSTLDKEDKTLYYINMDQFNMMQPNKEYYVVMYEKEFAQLYQENYGVRTFTFVPDNYSLIPVEMGGLHWFEKSDLKYEDVREYPYISLTKSQSETLEKNVKQALKALGINS